MSSLIVRRRLAARRVHRRAGARPFLIAIVGLLALASIGTAAGFGTLFGIYNSYADEYVPIEEKLLQRNVGLTEIYDRGGKDGGVLLGYLTNPDAQLLEPVPLEEISPYLVNATVSTEDNSYWDNPGINFTGLARAAYENYVLNEFGGGTGGSSITQQLIKNVYICPNINTAEDPDRCVTAERTLDRKLREIVYAVELTRDYTKEEILTWYLNQISYADRYIGIEAAAQGYFRKSAKDLTLAEAALLAGVPQYPTEFHPRLNCVTNDDGTCVVDQPAGTTTLAGAAKERQEAVLDLMVEHGRATAEEVAAAKLEVLKIYPGTDEFKASAWIDNQIEPRLVRMCKAGLLPMPDAVDDCDKWVHSAGYAVTTTLDWEATAAAQVMMRGFIETGLVAGCECHNAAIVTIEPSSGQVMVYAPNRDPSYTSDPRVAGNVDQLSEINQPGSSFKPAVYLNWFDTQNKAPMSIFWDTSPLTVEGTAITNPRTGGVTEGLISARAGLGGSQNVPAFRAAQEGGIDNVIETAKKLGITTLEQHFDPTFQNHEALTYGASIATGGANIRAIDMAYMDATIANMGRMVGTKHFAEYVELEDLKSTALDIGADYDTAKKQALEFQRGNIRIPGTRELDPIVVLEVRDKDGGLIYREPDEPESIQTIDAGSVWLLHSIMSDCTARFVIWGCGSTNNDTGLDFVVDGQRVPSGVKTGTQQGSLSASDTLETWMTGYSRHAATAVWVGNATNELVNDRAFAAANTTTKIWRNWMATYHELIRARGVTDIMKGFADLQPKNVAQRGFATPSTDRVLGGGFCDQTVTAWVRTDVTYASQCEEREIDTRNGFLASDQTPAQFRETKKFVKLPSFKPELAVELARQRNIPIAPTEKSTGQAALTFSNLQNGRTLSTTFQVVGTVNVPSLKSWKLEIGESANPTEWTTIGSGSANVTSDGPLGVIDPRDLKDNTVYTVRLSTDDGKGLRISVVINIKRTGVPNNPFGTPTPGGGPTATPNPNFPSGTVTPQLPE